MAPSELLEKTGDGDFLRTEVETPQPLSRMSGRSVADADCGTMLRHLQYGLNKRLLPGWLT